MNSLDRIFIPADLLMTVRASARGQFLPIGDGGRLYYETAGCGTRPVVLVPGTVRSSRVFDHVMTSLESSTRFRAVAFDSRGQGRSSRRPKRLSFDQHGRDLAELLRALRLANVVLVGWSTGVVKALAYIRQFGCANLRALVLLEGTPRATITGVTRDWAAIAGADGPGASEVDYTADLVAFGAERPILLAVPHDEQATVTRWAARRLPAAEVAGLPSVRPSGLNDDHDAALGTALEAFLSRLP